MPAPSIPARLLPSPRRRIFPTPWHGHPGLPSGGICSSSSWLDRPRHPCWPPSPVADHPYKPCRQVVPLSTPSPVALLWGPVLPVAIAGTRVAEFEAARMPRRISVYPILPARPVSTGTPVDPHIHRAIASSCTPDSDIGAAPERHAASRRARRPHIPVSRSYYPHLDSIHIWIVCQGLCF